MKISVEILSQKVKICLHYTGKTFKKLEITSGKFNSEILCAIGKIIPPSVDEVEHFQQIFAGKVIYQEQVKTKNLFSEFSAVWFTFYEDFMGFPPKFSATDGKALKSIETYFKRVCNDDEKALQTWQLLLSSWKKLDDFHQKNTDLKYINSNLNKILQNAKKLTTTPTASTYSSSFKRKIFEGFQS